MSGEGELFAVAVKLLRDFYPLEPLRLLGVRISSLSFGKTKEQRLMDKYLQPVEGDRPAIPIGRTRLRPTPSATDLLDPTESQSVAPLLTSPLPTSQPNPRPNGIKMPRLQCPVCSHWLTTTEYMLSIHMQDCGRKAATAKKPRKRGASLSLDTFTSKK